MAVARTVSLFERTVTERLSAAGIELMLHDASALSEGDVTGTSYQGSTVLTFDVATAAVADTRDAVTARRVAELCSRDLRLRTALTQVALREAYRLKAGGMATTDVDVRAHAQGTQVHLHVDVEATMKGLP